MNREQFSSWADLLPDAFLLTAPDGKIIAINPVAVRLLPPLCTAGHYLGTFLENPAEALQYFRRCSGTRSLLPGSLRFVGPAGTVAFRVDGAVVPQQDGVSHLLLRLREKSATLERFQLLDRTLHVERLANEVELRKRAEDQLRRERERFRVTLACIGEAVIATDAHSCITFLNAKAAQLTGWSAEEATGQQLNRVFRIINEKSREAAESPADRALRDGIVVGLANHTLLISKAGHEIAIDDSAAPIKADDGNVIGVVLVFRDITLRRAAEQHIESEYQRLESRVEERTAELVLANRTKDEFLMTLSHELRTPLSPIITAIHILRMSLTLAPEELRWVEVVDRNARAQVRLVDDLLDVSRILSGKLQFTMGSISVTAVLDQLVDTMRAGAEAKGIQITMPRATLDDRVVGDADRLHQVFWNLMSNAIKFTPAGGRITITVSETDRSVVIAVTDTGIGIAPQFLPLVFERFRQQDASSTREFGGLGLGLSISRHIVEEHRGRIDARSDGVGRGATFVVSIPTEGSERGRAVQDVSTA